MSMLSVYIATRKIRSGDRFQASGLILVSGLRFGWRLRLLPCSRKLRSLRVMAKSNLQPHGGFFSKVLI